MPTYTPQQSVELFHLVLLDMLGRKLDKRHYAVKGGCNFRFFLSSFRYSEDMDLDIQEIPKEMLEDAVVTILHSSSLEKILSVHGLRMESWSSPKQTELTQRWKFSLTRKDSEIALPTKIEFSRRGMWGSVLFESVNPHLIRSYQLTPIMASHYDPTTAFLQKVEALVSRRVTQARDVFDLHLLIASGFEPEMQYKGFHERLEEAKSRALAVTFDVFKAQVLSFLEAEYRAQYDSEELWDDMVLRIVEALERAQS